MLKPLLILAGTIALILGDATVVSSFEGTYFPKDRCLSDPLDPALIVSKIKEIPNRPPEKAHSGSGPSEDGSLEADLKDLLDL